MSVTPLAEFLEGLHERLFACIGDAKGQEAVASGRTLTLTKGQVGLLAEALQLIDVALVAERQRSHRGR